MKARCGVILLAATAALLGTGCSSTASAPGAPASATIPLLTVGTLSGNSTLNPLTTQGCATDFCGLFMERLLRFSPQNSLEPELATSVTQPSPVTYVYHLRHGVKAVKAVPGALFLDDQVAELPGGLRVIGSTLWSHVADGEIDRYTRMLAEHGLLGVDNIRLGDRFLTLKDTNELHRQARSFLEGQLRSLSRAERDKTIVCTHFWPTLRPWTGPDGQPESEWYHMTGSDMDGLIAECGPRLWLCGHAHTTHHVTIGTTQISSNPRAGDGQHQPGFP